MGLRPSKLARDTHRYNPLEKCESIIFLSNTVAALLRLCLSQLRSRHHSTRCLRPHRPFPLVSVFFKSCRREVGRATSTELLVPQSIQASRMILEVRGYHIMSDLRPTPNGDPPTFGVPPIKKMAIALLPIPPQYARQWLCLLL